MSAFVEVFGRVLLSLGFALVSWTFFLMTGKINEDSLNRLVTLMFGWFLIVFMVWVLFQ